MCLSARWKLWYRTYLATNDLSRGNKLLNQMAVLLALKANAWRPQRRHAYLHTRPTLDKPVLRLACRKKVAVPLRTYYLNQINKVSVMQM